MEVGKNLQGNGLNSIDRKGASFPSLRDIRSFADTLSGAGQRQSDHFLGWSDDAIVQSGAVFPLLLAGASDNATLKSDRNSGSEDKVAPEIHIDKDFNPLIDRIKNSDYGNEVWSSIINHPDLAALEIVKPDKPAFIRELLGEPPFVRTYHLKDTADGHKRGKIVMDPDMSTNISLYNGSTLDIGPDAVLFHELSHIYLDLQGKNNTEAAASLMEGEYGGYNRDYSGGATLKW